MADEKKREADIRAKGGYFVEGDVLGAKPDIVTGKFIG